MACGFKHSFILLLLLLLFNAISVRCTTVTCYSGLDNGNPEPNIKKKVFSTQELEGIKGLRKGALLDPSP